MSSDPSEITPVAYIKTTQVSEDECVVEQVAPQDEGGVPDKDGVIPFSFEVEHITFKGWIDASNPPHAEIEVKLFGLFPIFKKNFKIPPKGFKVSLPKPVLGFTGSLRFFLADKALKCEVTLHGGSGKHTLNIADKTFTLKKL